MFDHIVPIFMLLLGFGLWFGMVLVPYFADYRLKDIGIRVMGKVIDLREDDGVYWPTIEYRTPEGEVRYFKTSSATNLYKDLLNQELPVIYNPKNPNEVIFEHRSHNVEYKIYTLVSAGLVVVGIVLGFVLPS